MTIGEKRLAEIEKLAVLENGNPIQWPVIAATYIPDMAAEIRRLWAQVAELTGELAEARVGNPEAFDAMQARAESAEAERDRLRIERDDKAGHSWTNTLDKWLRELTTAEGQIKRLREALDEAWGRINALGGKHGEYDDVGRGVNHAVEQALIIIEELGGMDPLARAALARLDPPAQESSPNLERRVFPYTEPGESGT